MRVVAFTGLPGAGKTDAVDEARQRGIPIIVMGDFVREAAQAQGLALNDQNLGRTAQQMRSEQGADVIAQRTADEILSRHAQAALVVVDGVRSLPEIDAFRARFGAHFHLVAVEALDELRHARLSSRGRSDDPAQVQQMRERDEREKAWGLMEAIQKADARIRNDGSLQEFRTKVSRLFDRLTTVAAAGSESSSSPAASQTPP